MKSLFIFPLFCLCFISIAVAASTDSPYPYDKLNYIYALENAVPTRHLHPKISLTYWFYTASEYFDDSGHREDMFSTTYSQNWIVPAFCFGAGDVAEFGLALPILMEKMKSEGSYIEIKGSGVGDMLLWAKVAVTKRPWFGFRFIAKLPVGNDDLDTETLPTGSGQTDLDLGWQFSYMPEKMGFLCDANIGYRLRMEKELTSGVSYDPGEEGRLGVYLGGMPVEGFGIMFGGDGFITFNDQYNGNEVSKTYRASAMMGLKLFYKFPFGLMFNGSFKTDIAGKDSPAGFGFNLGASYEPKF